jgi:5-hydroxyisourate hydrolase
MTVSTHVLNATTGQPAAGLELTLSQQDNGEWRELSRRATDQDGRVRDLAGDVAPGVYRITFQTGAYLADTFYPEVTVVFRITDPGAHHHVPLLLSPYAYSTYRGS